MSSAKSLIKALRKFTDGEPSLKEQLDSLLELQASNDRSVAILAPIEVEEALKSVLLVWFRDLTADEKRDLFAIMQPLSTFSAKIRLTFAMGIIGPKTRDDLNIIRNIRNAFAHSGRAITFQTPEVAEACAFLHAPSLLPTSPHDIDWPPTDPIKQYRATATCIVQTLEAVEHPTPWLSVMP